MSSGMEDRRAVPYGAWPSPLSAAQVAAGMVQLGQVAVDGEDLYWIERRPAEGGRQVIVRRTADGRTMDLTPQPFNVRTRVHEYGGWAFAVSDGVLYFSHFPDQRVYRQRGAAEPQPLTAPQAMRYADGVIDRRRRRLICVREDCTMPDRESWVVISDGFRLKGCRNDGETGEDGSGYMLAGMMEKVMKMIPAAIFPG